MGIHQDLYTTNAMCSRSQCINPLFPALEDLSRLESLKWQCLPKHKVMNSMTFCQAAVNYDVAVPIPGDEGGTISSVVRKQEEAAITQFVFHLQGMGIEFWDHRRPEESGDPCVESVWKMVCYSYFPKGEPLCQEGQETKYMRPCQSSCQNYLKFCGVECCDESVKCVFDHTQHVSTTAAVTTKGYIPHDAPNDLCTGAATGVQATLALTLPFLALLTRQ